MVLPVPVGMRPGRGRGGSAAEPPGLEAHPSLPGLRAGGWVRAGLQVGNRVDVDAGGAVPEGRWCRAGEGRFLFSVQGLKLGSVEQSLVLSH